MEFGQFMDHDVTLTPIATALNGFNFNCRACDAKQKVSSNCRPISIPLTDTSMSPFVNGTTERRCLAFIRSASGRTAFGAREQVNQNTAYIDASMVYGSSLCKTKRLRTFSDGMCCTVYCFCLCTYSAKGRIKKFQVVSFLSWYHFLAGKQCLVRKFFSEKIDFLKIFPQKIRKMYGFIRYNMVVYRTVS